MRKIIGRKKMQKEKSRREEEDGKENAKLEDLWQQSEGKKKAESRGHNNDSFKGYGYKRILEADQ